MTNKYSVIRLGILLVIAIVASCFLLRDVNIRDTIPVTKEIWVNVVNIDGVENLDRKFKLGELGEIKTTGKIKRIFEYENQVWVRYLTPDYTATENEIPAGTIFFLSKAKFLKMSQRK